MSAVALRIIEAKSHELKTDLQGALQHYAVATMNVYYTLYKMQLQMPQQQNKPVKYMNDLPED